MAQKEKKTVQVIATVVSKIFASEDVEEVANLSNKFLEEIRRKQYALMSTTHMVRGNDIVNVITYQKPLNPVDKLNIKKL